MKKVLIVLSVIILFASSSFASVSFLTANPVGEGNWAVLGMYATNHDGGANFNPRIEPGSFDTNSLGVRGEYGIMKDLDVLMSYSMDTMTNIKDVADPNDAKQTSGNTMAIGLKYLVSKAGDMLPVDFAVAGGYEQNSLGIQVDNSNSGGGVQNNTLSMTTLSIAAVFSKKMGMCVPYGAIAYKMLSQNVGKMGGAITDPYGGTAIGINLGCAVGIMENQAVMIEYNSDNQAWDGTRVHMTKGNVDGYNVNVSGISLGYVCMF